MNDRKLKKRKEREKRIRDAKLREQRTPAQVARDKAASRQCGDCQACCTALSIPTLQKPRQTTCPNQCAAGCAIYASRPSECAGYLCLWRQGWGGNDDRPDKLGAVLDLEESRPFATLGGGRSNKMVIRVHLLDQTQPPSEALRAHVAQLVRAGETVVYSYADRQVVHGPTCPPTGVTLAIDVLDEINRQIKALGDRPSTVSIDIGPDGIGRAKVTPR